MYWSLPQFLGRSFQKARNFTASSHQHAGFSIWVSEKYSGVDTPGPLQREGANPLPHPTPGRKRPGVGSQTLVPLNFSAVVAPLSAGRVASDLDLRIHDIQNVLSNCDKFHWNMSKHSADRWENAHQSADRPYMISLWPWPSKSWRPFFSCRP